MPSQFDRILKAQGLRALVVSLHEGSETSFRWLSRAAAVTRGHVIVIPGAEPLLIHYPMERDEATAAGVATRSAAGFGYPEVFASATSAIDGWRQFFTRILQNLDVSGPVMFAGHQPLHIYLPLVRALEQHGIEVAHGDGTDLLQMMRRTKSAEDIEQIRSVGARTEAVVAGIRELLRAAEIREGAAHLDGTLLTIGRIKDEISAAIVAHGMIEDHETIVSHGRDAGVPHSRGDRSQVLRAGVPLVIDIFPRDAKSGWFFDLTRTFCVGEIPARLADVHALVLEAHTRAVNAAVEGTYCAALQRMTCEFFRNSGYPTVLDEPGTERGYVHGLGHGVGLDVHELPSFALAHNTDRLSRGDVFTIEPGLYDPDRDIGVRIEDTLYIGEDGITRSFSSSDRSLAP